MPITKKAYRKDDYVIKLERENGVVYYDVFRESKPVANGFLVTEDTFYQVAEGIAGDIDRGTIGDSNE